MDSVIMDYEDATAASRQAQKASAPTLPERDASSQKQEAGTLNITARLSQTKHTRTINSKVQRRKLKKAHSAKRSPSASSSSSSSSASSSSDQDDVELQTLSPLMQTIPPESVILGNEIPYQEKHCLQGSLFPDAQEYLRPDEAGKHCLQGPLLPNTHELIYADRTIPKLETVMASKAQMAEMTLPWYQNDVVRLVAGSAFVAVTCIAAVYVAPVVMTVAATTTVKAPVFAVS
ncbi:unnamed protein product [Mortierella alpina]